MKPLLLAHAGSSAPSASANAPPGQPPLARPAAGPARHAAERARAHAGQPARAEPAAAAGPVFVPQNAAMATAAPIEGLTLSAALERARQYSQQFYGRHRGADRARGHRAGQGRAAAHGRLASTSSSTRSRTAPPPASSSPTTDRTSTTIRRIVHGDIWRPASAPTTARAMAAEAVARARADIAARGLIAVVVQNYYAMLVAQRKLANAQQSLQRGRGVPGHHAEAGAGRRGRPTPTWSRRRSRRAAPARPAGRAARSRQGAHRVRRRCCSPTYGQQFTRGGRSGDRHAAAAVPRNPGAAPAATIRTSAPPQATGHAADLRAHVRRAPALYPTLSFDYFYGINANQFAVHNRDGQQPARLGGAGAVDHSGLELGRDAQQDPAGRAAGCSRRRTDLSFTQRQLLANLNAFYAGGAGSPRRRSTSLRRIGGPRRRRACG